MSNDDNNKMNMMVQIDEKEPFAIGVGVSLNAKFLTDENPRINGSITLGVKELSSLLDKCIFYYI